MAKAIITLEDGDGEVNIAMEFDPPLSDDTFSEAQYTAIKFLQLTKKPKDDFWHEDEDE